MEYDLTTIWNIAWTWYVIEVKAPGSIHETQWITSLSGSSAAVVNVAVTLSWITIFGTLVKRFDICEFIKRENEWQIASFVTPKSLFTVAHALFFIHYTHAQLFNFSVNADPGQSNSFESMKVLSNDEYACFKTTNCWWRKRLLLHFLQRTMRQRN